MLIAVYDGERSPAVLTLQWKRGRLSWVAGPDETGRQATRMLKRILQHLQRERPAVPLTLPSTAPFSLRHPEHAAWLVQRLQGLRTPTGNTYRVRVIDAADVPEPAKEKPTSGRVVH